MNVGETQTIEQFHNTRIALLFTTVRGFVFGATLPGAVA